MSCRGFYTKQLYMVAALVVVALAAAAAALPTSLTLNNTAYHVLSGLPSHASYHCFEQSDIHLLNGTVTDHGGGNVSVHVANGTMPDYTITVDPAVQSQGSLRNVTMSFTCKGAAYVEAGLTYIFRVPTGEQAVQFRLQAAGGGGSVTLLLGPNPPPPPPQPAQCDVAENQTACDTVKPTKGSAKGCAWCTSDDKVHSGCYDALHEPDPTAWSCDK